VVELFGLTTILLPVKPPGFHVKVPPETEAEAIRVADWPLQIDVPKTVITGVGFTVIAAVEVPGQPPVGVKVTV
jgi:hypothetical protein